MFELHQYHFITPVAMYENGGDVDLLLSL